MNAPRSVFPTTPPKPTSRKVVWISVTAVIVVLAIAAVLVVVLNRGNSEPTTAPTTSTPVATPPPTSTATGGSGFTGTTVDKLNKPIQLPANPAGEILPQTGKTPADANDAPTGLLWQKVYDLPIVPFSTSDGPTEIKDGVAQGWAHTPQGAALAGLFILNTWLTAPDDVSKVVQRDLLSGEPSVIDRTTELGRKQRQVALTYPNLSATTVQGVQIQPSSSKDFYQVSWSSGPFVSDDEPNGYYTSASFAMSWVDGGWKLIVTPTSPSSNRGEHRTSIAGMTPWTD